MPVIREELSGKAPDQPHLGVLRRGDVMLAMPPGSNMFIVTDPTRPDGVLPLLLVKVTEKAITFRCNCGESSCTRVLQYRLKATGWHPQSKR